MLRPATAIALLALTACAERESAVTLLARQAAADPPTLWLVEALDPQGQPRDAVRVCADSPVRYGFTHPIPVAGGAMCLRERNAWRARPDGYVERCELNGVRYGLRVAVVGDPQQDFTVHFAMHPLNGAFEGPRQARRHRLLGACPAGWAIGDSDKPGDGPRPNVLS